LDKESNGQMDRWKYGQQSNDSNGQMDRQDNYVKFTFVYKLKLFGKELLAIKKKEPLNLTLSPPLST
jgi:hypothetical protein